MVNASTNKTNNLRFRLASLRKDCQQKTDFTALIDYIDKLPSEYKNKIRVIRTGSLRSRCYDFAFGATISHKNVVGEMIKNHALIRELTSVEMKLKGDIVIYFSDRKPIHAGKVFKKDLIISKWETGPIIAHEVFMVPINYGKTVKYYRIINKNGVRKFLNNFRLIQLV